MTDKPDDLDALADRVEREEPSATLDSDIVHAVGQPWTHPHMVMDPEIGPIRAPYFTTSLDAAASLVPGGYEAAMISTAINGDCDVVLRRLSSPRSLSARVYGHAPDEPRARTAAALRAIASNRRAK